ncbi:MAG TPA: hypothetical protein VFQ38_21180 [Longimicrobiales bacterium]|nr:hypothetical protein [Longimicrobiales bacterium]
MKTWLVPALAGLLLLGAAAEVSAQERGRPGTAVVPHLALGPVSLGGALGLIHVDGLHMSAGARVGADLSRHVRAERLLRGGAVYVPVALGWRIPLPHRE